MAAEWMQFPRRGNGGTISPNLGVIREMSGKQVLRHPHPGKRANGQAVRPRRRLFREIDCVLGKEKPLRVYEPLGLKHGIAEVKLVRLRRFGDALSDFRARRFDKAAKAFDSLAADDPVAQRFAERARAYLALPPPEDWDGVNTLVEK